jgi:hypothetical protein
MIHYTFGHQNTSEKGSGVHGRLEKSQRVNVLLEKNFEHDYCTGIYPYN